MRPRLDPLIEAQARELDQEARRQQFREMEAILSEGTSHYINLFWLGRAGALDFRLQNFKPPWHPHTIWTYEHVWWDEDAPLLGPDAPPNQ